uniref:Tripartite motif-containing protein 2 n=2 Tax=Macrostomum lignano TaxID=282301 RepID=A0A1I8H5K2_9PLAT
MMASSTQQQQQQQLSQKDALKPVLPQHGMLFQEHIPSAVLCKPKLLPLKSFTLERLELLQRDAEETVKRLQLEETGGGPSDGRFTSRGSALQTVESRMASRRLRDQRPVSDSSDSDNNESADAEQPATPVQCSVKLCHAASVGRGPYNKLLLCQRHLAPDIAKVRQLRASVLERAVAAIASAEAVRPKQLRLATELQQLTDVFDELHSALDSWQERLTAPVRAQHDALVESLQIASECRAFQRDLAAADAAGDLTKVFELANSVDPLLPNPNAEAGADVAESSAAAAPAVDVDASGSLRNLLVPVDSELTHLTGLLEGSRERAARDPSCYAEFAGCLEGFEAAPVWLAVCCNTAGFGASPDRQRLMKGGATPLPRQMLFVSFDADERLDYMAAVSLDGRLRLRLHSGGGVDFRLGVSGLHCDDGRQLLYICLTPEGVCVTDLAGAVQQKITPASLGLISQPPAAGAAAAAAAASNAANFRFSGPAGTPDKLFVNCYRQRTVLVVGKKDLALHAKLSLGPGSSTFDGGLAVTNAVGSGSCGTAADDPSQRQQRQHSLLLACDWAAQSVHRVCPASGRLLSPPLCAPPVMEAPLGIAVDCRRGVAFVSDYRKASVRVLLLEGGSGGGSGRDWQPPLAGPPFANPAGLAVAETGDGGATLFVADSGRKCIVTYSLL